MKTSRGLIPFLTLVLLSCQNQITPSHFPVTTVLTLTPVITPTPIQDFFSIVDPPPAETMVVPQIGNDGSLYLENRLLLESKEFCFRGHAGEISYSPNGNNFLVSVYCLEHIARSYVFDADGSHKQDIGIIQSGYSWSPDGQNLIFASSTGSYAGEGGNNEPMGLFHYDVQTQKTSKFLDNLPALDPKWSPDGRWIAFSTWDLKIRGNCCLLYWVDADGKYLWSFDAKLSSFKCNWLNTKPNESANLRCISDNENESYIFSFDPVVDAPSAGTPIPITPIPSHP